MYQLSTRHNGEPVISEHSTYNQAMVCLLDHLAYWHTQYRVYVTATIYRVDSEINKVPLTSYNSVDGWMEPT